MGAEEVRVLEFILDRLKGIEKELKGIRGHLHATSGMEHKRFKYVGSDCPGCVDPMCGFVDLRSIDVPDEANRDRIKREMGKE